MRPEDAARIYADNRAFMFGVAVNHVHDADAAEDVVQEAALKMLRQRSAPSDERGLAYTVTDYAAHEALDPRRSARASYAARTEPLDLDNPLHHQRAPSAEHAALAEMAVREAWDAAPESVRLHALGYPVEEILRQDARRRGPRAIAQEIERWHRQR